MNVQPPLDRSITNMPLFRLRNSLRIGTSPYARAVARPPAIRRARARPETPRPSSFFFQAEDGIRDLTVTGVQTCALPISGSGHPIQQFPTVHAHWPCPSAQEESSGLPL